MFGAIDWGFRVILVTDALCGSADGNARCRDECLHEPVRREVETVTTKTLLESWQSTHQRKVCHESRPLRISCNSSCRRKPAKSGPYKQATALPCREARELRASSDRADAFHLQDKRGTVRPRR